MRGTANPLYKGSIPLEVSIQMKANLFIPTKIRIGYQERKDTYTGKLAYVIYYDQKNTLRKETSWNSWRDKKIEAQDFDNVPTQGFVLNKNVGGYKSDWNYRQSHIRVYDPRGFEFEISVENLLFILQESNCDKGKGLDGEFIYSWEGTELVLLPISSVQYQDSLKFTSLKSVKIPKKDLIVAATYLDKDLDKCVYLGVHTVYDQKVFEKQHLLYYIDQNRYTWSSTHKDLKEIVDPNPHSDYSTILDKFLNSTCGSPIDRLELRNIPDTYYIINKYYKNNKTYFWAEKAKDINTYNIFYYHEHYSKEDSKTIHRSDDLCLVNGLLHSIYNRNDRSDRFYIKDKTRKSIQLFAILKSGKEVILTPENYFFYNIEESQNPYEVLTDPSPQVIP